MICLTVLRATALEASLLTAPASSLETPPEGWSMVTETFGEILNLPSPNSTL